MASSPKGPHATVVPTDRYQKLCIYNPHGHLDKGQHAEIVIQVRNVDSVVGATSSYASQPKKQPDAFSLRNNPQGLQYFPFPKSFRRKVAEVDLTKHVEMELLEPIAGEVPIKFDPEEITTDVAGQKKKFTNCGLEMAFSRRAKKYCLVKEEMTAAVIEGRKQYVEEHPELVEIFDLMINHVLKEKPITPKAALADLLFKGYEADRIERDRKQRRFDGAEGVESKILIPKPPTKVIEYKLEDERRRQEQKDKKAKRIQMLEEDEAEKKLIQKGRDLLRSNLMAKTGAALKNKLLARAKGGSAGADASSMDSSMGMLSASSAALAAPAAAGGGAAEEKGALEAAAPEQPSVDVGAAPADGGPTGAPGGADADAVDTTTGG